MSAFERLGGEPAAEPFELTGGLPVLERTDFEGLGERREGKVRDVYESGDRIILVATDRFSAFDRNLALIPFKGQVIPQVSQFWFDRTKHIIPNHVIETPDPNVVVGERCEVISVEVIVRGFITGTTNTSLWVQYQEGQRNFGDFRLPNGMRKNQRLARPVITPTTKDEHDTPLTGADVVNEGYADAETWRFMTTKARRLFDYGQRVAFSRGLIIVDTKFEFGRTPDGQIKLVDELFTPDSSRYWRVDEYIASMVARPRREPQNYDKEFLRLWFKSNSRPYEDETMPEAPPEMVQEMTRRNIFVYERLTGRRFVPDLSDPQQRIARNLGLAA